MKTQRILATTTVVLGVISLICLVAFYLALHDIAQDYVSPTVLGTYGYTESLPEWTAGSLEWKVLTYGFWPMLLFHIAFLTSCVLWWQRRDASSRLKRSAQQEDS